MQAAELFEHMREKYGFDDGDNVPPYADEARSLLISAFNRLLPADCPVKAYAFDRPGCHNYCLILWADKSVDTTIDIPPSDPTYFTWLAATARPTPNEAFDILDLLDDADYLNSCIATTIVVDATAAISILTDIAADLEWEDVPPDLDKE